MQDKANSILINASRMDEEFDGIATGLSTAITKDGQTTVTADLPMAGFKHTGVANASARNQYAAVAQVQDGATAFAAAGGTANALTLTVGPAVTAYAAGQIFWARLTATNTSATPTLAVSGLAAKTIKKRGGAPLVAGDLTSGDVAGFAYQSSTDDFRLVGPTKDTGLVLIDSQTAANSATLDFTSGFGGEYDEILFEIVNFRPATDGVALNGRVSTDAGVTFKAGTDYEHWRFAANGSSASLTASASTGQAQATLAIGNVGNQSGEGVTGTVTLSYPGGTAAGDNRIVGDVTYYTSDPTPVFAVCRSYTSYKASSEAVNGFRFAFASGSVASGTIRMWGRRKV